MNLEDVLTIEEDFSTSLDVKAKTNGIYLEIEDEWCGDTETGFGQIVGINLAHEQVQQVYEFLGKWLAAH